MKNDSLDKFVQEISTLMFRIAGEFRHLVGELAADEGLSHPQAMLLLLLLDNGTASMGDVSRFMGTTQGVATRLMDRLVGDGMVTRRRDPDDGRVVLVDLTPTGKRLAGRMMDVHLSEIRRFFAGLSDEALDSFLTMITEFDRQLRGEGKRNNDHAGSSRIVTQKGEGK